MKTIISVSKKASSSASVKELTLGAYFSKTAPKAVSARDLADPEEIEAAAVLFPEETRGPGIAYVWKTEVPKLIVELDTAYSIFEKATKIFSQYKTAKFIKKLSAGDVGAVYQVTGGFLTIGISND